MEMWQELHFLRPYFLLALVLPVVFFWRTFKGGSAQSTWGRVCDAHLLQFLLVKNGGGTNRRIPLILAAIIAGLTIVALAGPTFTKKENPALSVENPLMFVLNNSSVMLEKNVTPNRLERAKYIIGDLLSALDGAETGLLVYSREPFVISPMAEDPTIIGGLLPSVEFDVMPENGDRLDRAIDMAVERMQAGGYNFGNLVILTSDVGEMFDASLESAAKAVSHGFAVNIINVNTESNEKLKMVAAKGNGIYLNYNQNLTELSNKINNLFHKRIKQSENMQNVWLDAGYYLFWLPALLLLYFYRRGMLTLLLVGGWLNVAEAGWFLNDNQEAMRAFENKDYTKATTLFTDADWRGSAAYKNGDFATAYAEFAKGNDETALYNQGNALAKAGKIDEAIKKYEEVLQKNKDFADAEFNLEYLKKQQRQQNQQQNNQQDNQQRQNEDKQQQSSSSSQAQNGENNDRNEQRQEQNKQEKQNAENNNAQSAEQNDSQNAEPKEDTSSQTAQQTQNQEQQNGDMQKQNEQNNEADDKQTEENKSQNQENAPNQNNKQEETTEQNEQNNGTSEKQAREGEDESLSGAYAKPGDVTPEEREKIQAKMQKFREIPEDKGGLLRAFILREYKKNRYEN